MVACPGSGRSDREESNDGQGREAVVARSRGRDRRHRRRRRGRELRRRERGDWIEVERRAGHRHWGHERSDETLLTGDRAAKVRALALAKVPGGTVVRVETDADGNSAYEAHMVKADGTPATVYVSKDLEVVSVQTGRPGPPA